MRDNFNFNGHIGVMMGGDSSEREISLKSGKAIYQALQERGCRVSILEISSCSEEEVRCILDQNKVDIVFLALHGGAGEDGRVQAILEKYGVIYCGSDAKASQMAMNKVRVQRFLKGKGIPVPAHAIFSKKDKNPFPDAKSLPFPYPVVVKPASEGSSIGVTIVHTAEELSSAIKEAYRYGDEILIEQYIGGTEVTAGILGQDALPLVEIRPRHAFFNFFAKYHKGETDYIVPAEVSAEVTKSVQSLARASFGFLGCRDFARADFIIADKQPYFLEINTIPGFTATSLLPMAAAQAGYSFTDLCLKIIEFANSRHK